ncbi:MAG: alpha/beta fold hydrolase [Myxococcota bacterium]
MQRTKFEFDNGRGQRLAGRLEEPLDTPRGYALFAHCFTCSKDIAAATRISRALVDRGFGVLRFDFTGLGNSEGDFSNENFGSNVQDLLSAATAMSAAGKAPHILIGHSLGGAAVLSAAPDVESALAVVTIAAPSDPGHVTHLLRDDIETIAREGSAEVCLAGRSFRIEHHFLKALEEHRLEPRLRALGKALLILHSPTDEVVEVDQARRIFALARHPKSFVSLDDADHLLSRPRDSQYVADLLASWASRYLPPAPEFAPPGEGESVRVTSLPRLAQRVQARQHVARADEPVRLGGNDSGMTPYEYLLAALGTCTAMTLKLYAQRKQWPLDEVRVGLRHERTHRSDAEGEGRVEKLFRTLDIVGNLEAEQRARLLEIADRCPVHRTLESCPEIVTDLLEPT